MSEINIEELNCTVQHDIKILKMYEQLYKAAEKIGFNYSFDIMTILHNEVATRIGYIEQDSDYDLLIKIWKDHSVHIYDRAEYVGHTQGKEAKMSVLKGKAYREAKRRRNAK